MNPDHLLDLRSYSWESFGEAVALPPSAAWGRYAVQSIANEASPSWDDGLGYDGAVALLRGERDWPKGRRRIEDQAATQATRSIRKHAALDYQPDVSGDFFDLGAIVENRPEQWLSLQEVEHGIERSLVNVVCNVSAGACVSANAIIDRTVACAAAVMTLEAWNIPTALWTIEYTSVGANMHAAMLIAIKPAGSPLDLHRLTVMAHPAYLRRLHFRLTEQTPDPRIAADWHLNYGRPDNPDPADLATWVGVGESVYLPKMHSDSEAVETARVLQALLTRRLGLPKENDNDD